MEQKILNGADRYDELHKWIKDRKVLVVFGRSCSKIKRLTDIIDGYDNVVRFSDFAPNPVYESVVEGVELFNRSGCDSVMAIGGGSAMDVAKCIKLYSGMDQSKNYLEQEIPEYDIPLWVIPTTAGTGSEATRYAVIYYNGEKKSITSDQCIPDTVILDPDNLKSLPLYQRKATMLDALAHAIESLWSVNSTEQSKIYSRDAISKFLQYSKGYLDNTDEGNEGMQMASYSAGKAINITQTTAGHAMSYKITSLLGCAHGHAAMLCNRKLFPWMLDHMNQCADKRGQDYLMNVFQEVASSLGHSGVSETCDWLENLMDSLELNIPLPDEAQMKEMIGSVNQERLKNNPVRMDMTDIEDLYCKIFDMD